VIGTIETSAFPRCSADTPPPTSVWRRIETGSFEEQELGPAKIVINECSQARTGDLASELRLSPETLHPWNNDALIDNDPSLVQVPAPRTAVSIRRPKLRSGGVCPLNSGGKADVSIVPITFPINSCHVTFRFEIQKNR